jgi:regulator of PEP synthase PpsR (kinase-PPPase family)
MNAINFSLAHDDGQISMDLESADIILIGPSRTSKSPTSVYLAYRGYKTANIPYVLGQNLPDSLKKMEKTLVVGLLINPERLVDIRKNRLVNINDISNHGYVDHDLVYQELAEVKKIYKQNNWPIIDVTRKSVEEVAANIITIYNQRNSL